jgi:hypothetical protein
MLGVGLNAVALPSISRAETGDGLIVQGNVIEGQGTYIRHSLDRSSLEGVKKIPQASIRLDWTSREGEVGRAVRTVTMGITTSDDKGNYRIVGQPTPEMVADAAQNDGWLNFNLISVVGSKYTIGSLSRHWDGKGWTDYGDERPDMSPGDNREVAFVTDSKTGKARYGILDSAESNGAVDPLGPGGCLQIVTSSATYWTNVVEFHNSPDSDGHWEYGATADSDIEVGISYDATNWGADGTSHVGNSLGGSVYGNTSTLFGQYVATQIFYEGGYYSWPCTNTWFVRPSTWSGGTSYTFDVSQYDCLDSPQSAYQQRYEQYTGFTKNSSRAITFGIGAHVGVFSARSTSGYSTRVDMNWYWARNWGYLCGNDNIPLYAKIVYAY